MCLYSTDYHNILVIFHFKASFIENYNKMLSKNKITKENHINMAYLFGIQFPYL